MKSKFKYFLLLALVLWVVGGFSVHSIFISYHTENIPLPVRPKFIAHGGGGIPEIGRISNSKDALSHSFSKGYKLIEVDFHWTKDNQLVLIHDWEWAYEKWFNLDSNSIPTLKEFLDLEMKQGLTQVTFNDLLLWMQEHEDVSIVTDVKKDNLKALNLIYEAAGGLSNRIIPQAYSRAEYHDIREIGFSKVILTLYRTKAWNFLLIRFADRHPDVFAITMRPERAKRGNLGIKLKRRGVFVYAHTINDSDEYIELQKVGVAGIYTDYLIGLEHGEGIYDLRSR